MGRREDREAARGWTTRARPPRLAWALAPLIACSSGEDAAAPEADAGVVVDASVADAGPAAPDWGPVDAPDAPGPYAVGHAAFTAVDAARDDRSIPIHVWYPVLAEDAEGAPPTEYPLAPPIELESERAVDEAPVAPDRRHRLVVFSHGYESISLQSIELMEALASHGFIVASPEHTGNAQPTPGDPFDVAAANRVPDVSFVIDTMLARSNAADDLLHERIDEGAVGVAGNSFGAMTAIGMAAGWAGAPPDPRVTAIAPVSAVIDGDLQSDQRESPSAGFTAAQLGSVSVPVLLIGGTEDTNVPIENNAIAFEGLVAAPSVYKVDIVGANHTHFANVCTFGDLLLELGLGQDAWAALGAEALIEPYEATCTEDAFPIERAVRLQSLFIVAFLRLHLGGESDYGQFLTATYADEEPDIRFERRVPGGPAGPTP